MFSECELIVDLKPCYYLANIKNLFITTLLLYMIPMLYLVSIALYRLFFENPFKIPISSTCLEVNE